MEKVIFPKTNPVIERMTAIYKGLADMASYRTNYAASLVAFSKKLLIIIGNVCPEFMVQFNEIDKQYALLSQVQIEFAKIEMRTSNDFRDPVERYYALERYTDRYETENDNYESKSQELIESMAQKIVAEKRSDYFKVQAKVENRIIVAKAEKKAARDVLSHVLNDVIEQKKKYNVFKARRLAHAYTNYSTGLKQFLEKSSDIYHKIAEIFDEMIKNGLPEEIAQAIKSQEPTLDNTPQDLGKLKDF